MAMTAKKTAIALGGIDGKKMKAICAFGNRDNALHLFHTPFVYNGHILATNGEAAVIVDATPHLRVPLCPSKCYSLPSDMLERMLVRDVFYFSENQEGVFTLDKLSEGRAELVDASDKLATSAAQLLEMAEEKHSAKVDISSIGFAPTLVKKVCALADAYGAPTMIFETVPQERGRLPRLQVSFPTHPGIKVIVMPKKL